MCRFVILFPFLIFISGKIFGSQSRYEAVSAGDVGDTIFIESDEVRIKKNDNIVVFMGNVKIRRNEINILAKKTAILHYIENNYKIEPDIIDMVDITITRGDNMKITGDRGSYDFVSSMLTIEDNVVISEKNSTTFASKVLYNTITEEIEMFGRKMESDPIGKTTIIINNTKTLLRKNEE
jgi:lipopolysaccharide transport protein LptA